MDEPILINGAMEIAVKTTVVLGVFALLALAVCRGWFASARHGVWSIGLSAAIAVPVFVLLMPGWAVLPGLAGSDMPEAVAAAPAVLGEVNKEANLPNSPGANGAVGSATGLAGDAGDVLGTAENGGIEIPVSIGMMVLWCAGVLVLLGRIGLGILSLNRLGTRSRSVCDRGILEVFEEVRDRMGVRGEVRILIGGERVMPMSWGIFTRTILLPDEAAEWGRGPLRSVLFHELAHLERRDPLHLLCGKVACALHWFHPLVWFAAWRQQVESELACDDRVLDSGVRGSDYATHLLEVVTGSGRSPQGAGMAVAMARSASQLESRVAAAVDPGKNRRRNSRAAIGIGCALALGFVVPVSMLTAAAPEAPEAPEEEAAADPEGSEDGDSEERASAERYWESLIANQERLRQLVKTGYEAGTAAMSEVLAAEAEVYDSKLGLARVRGDREGVLDALRGKVEVAKTRIAMAKKRYAQGMVTEKEILVLQGDVLKAQIELEEAKPKAVRKPAAAVGVPAAPVDIGGANPEDVYLEGFLAFRKGEELIEKGDLLEGVAKLKESAKLFEFIERNWPSWQREMVQFRLRTLREEIARATADSVSAAGGEDFEILPPSFELWVRDGDEVVKAPAADLAVAKGYWGFKDKGKLRGGQRITIMTAKTRYKVGEEIRVIHVLEATVPGIEVSNVGPKLIFEEYVDGELMMSGRDSVIEVIRGSMKDSPAADFLYEITSYKFDEPGEHTIQWEGGGHAHEADLGLESNVLRIVVEK